MSSRIAFSLAGALAAAAICAAAVRVQEPAKKPEVLRFSGIPDADKDKLTKQFGPVAEYLSKKLGLKVEYVHAPDYVGSVTALAANKIDLAWFGGVTAVQAEERTKGEVTFVAARENDLKFKSYFIANKALVESGKLKKAASLDFDTVDALKALGPAFKGLSFTFGDKSSTSGHFMPRHFLETAGLDPEASFKGKPGFQLQGGHSATLRAVASGAFDLGVLNYTNWEKADDESKANAPVVYVTPAFVDYCFVAHKRIGPELTEAIRKALLELDPKNPEHKPVLDAFSAPRFVAADPKMWDEMRAVMASAAKKGVGL